jgi:hypothetical protein
MEFNLTNETLIEYALKCYTKPHYIVSEFEEDYKRIQYLQKLFYRYKNRGELKERLILNHMIILSNVFGVTASVRILFLRIDKDYHPILKSFLSYLNLMPKTVYQINGVDIESDSIELDQTIIKTLREI